MTQYYSNTNVNSNLVCTGSIKKKNKNSIKIVEIDGVSESIIYMAQYYVDDVHGKLDYPKDF